MNSTLSASAAEWAAAGFDVFPVRPDGSKAPIGRWGSGAPPLAEVQASLDSGRSDGIGVVLGSAVCVELEGRAVGRLGEVDSHPLMQLLSAGCCEKSPSGGRHWFFRVDGDPGPKSVPAKGAGGETLAEYRTGRHFMVVAPSGGRTHPTGRPYAFLAGGPATIPTLTAAEAEEVRSLLGRLNEWEPAEPQATTSGRRLSAAAIAYNASHDIGDLLTHHGWRRHGRPYHRPDLGADAPVSQDFTRPGLARRKSATLTGKTLRVWSSSTPLPSEVPLTAFDVAVAYGESVEASQLPHHEPRRPTTPTTLEAQRDEAGERLDIEAAYAAVSGGGEVLLDRSATGSGKSYRAISICNGRRSLTVLPTHANCSERAGEFADRGLKAVTFPDLDELTCHPDMLDEARESQALGLSLGSTVCSRCRYRRGCHYQRQSKAAKRADHRIATHSRLLASPGIAQGVDVVVVDEQVDDIFSPVSECQMVALDLVDRVAAEIPGIAEAVRAVRAGEVPPPLTLDASEERRLLRLFRRGKVERALFGEGVRFLLSQYTRVAIVAGTVLGFRRPPIPDGVVRLACDATGGGRLPDGFIDITPAGDVPAVHPVIQRTGVDVTRGTRPAVTHQLVGRFLAEHPEVQRLGVICHRHAATGIIHPRIARVTYFGRGDDRASNEWHRKCDALLVIGTPRVPAVAVRIEVVKAGGSGDGDGEFGRRTWEGSRADGSPVIVPTIGYRDPEWFEASKRLTRAGLQQAVGRARATLDDGVPVTVYGREAGLQSLIEDAAVVIWTDAEIDLLRVLADGPKTIRELARLLAEVSEAGVRRRVERAGHVVELRGDGRVWPTVEWVDTVLPPEKPAEGERQNVLPGFERSDVVEVLEARLGQRFERSAAVVMLRQRVSKATAYRWISEAISAGELRPVGGGFLEACNNRVIS